MKNWMLLILQCRKFQYRVASLAVEELPDTSNRESVVYIVQFIVKSVRK